MWGPATAHGVGILSKLYVIYTERNASHLAIVQYFDLGPTFVLIMEALSETVLPF